MTRAARAAQLIEARRNTPIIPLWDRFWAKVDMSGGLTTCWPWTGAQTIKRKGKDWPRGVVQEAGRGSRILLAHRVALCFAGEGLREYGRPEQAAHRCGNRLCCNNYSHLYWGTRMENEADRKAHENGARLHVQLDVADELRALLAEVEAAYTTGVDQPPQVRPDDTMGSVRLRRMTALQSAILAIQIESDKTIPF